jgi:REP-associated tyrosine transposase
VDLVLQQFLRAATRERVDILAYCFMPDHVHLVVQGRTEDSDICKFVSLAKQFSGFRYRSETGLLLWQPSCFDRVLRTCDNLTTAIRYLAENPIRAGLAARVNEYPFVGSAVMTRDQFLAGLDGEWQA